MEKIYVKTNYSDNQFFNRRLYNLRKQEDSTIFSTLCISVSEYIYKNNKDFQKYLNYSDNSYYLRYFIDLEKNFGLSGLAGTLIILNELSCDREIISYGIEKLLDNVIDTPNGKMIKINKDTASPYLSTGSAGVIKALLNIDAQKYKKIICELSRGIMTYFAQYPDYWNGMLGISDTLLDVYLLTNDRTYIEFATSLLITSSYYLEFDRLPREEFMYVFNRFDNLLFKKGAGQYEFDV